MFSVSVVSVFHVLLVGHGVLGAHAPEPLLAGHVRVDGVGPGLFFFCIAFRQLLLLLTDLTTILQL